MASNDRAMSATAGRARIPRGIGGWGCLAAFLLALLIIGGAVAMLIGVVRVDIGRNAAVTTSPPRSDQDIRLAVEAALKQDVRLPGGESLVVTVNHGQITLSGTVESFTQRIAAGDVAQHIAGATLLNNQVQVQPATPIADDELQRTIQSGLAANATTHDAKLTVTVQGGVATLGGTANSLLMKRVAEDMASSVVGVRDIKDTITVEPSVNRTDAEITAELQRSIADDPLLRDQDIRVRVTGGKIILTGTVRDLTSQELAKEFAAYTPGARDLDNQLQVQP